MPLAALTAAALAAAPMPASPSPHPAEIRIASSAEHDGGWREITYFLPADGVHSFFLRDMTNRSANCPPVEYAVRSVSGARTIEGAEPPPRAIIYLEPDGEPFITVRVAVRMTEPEPGLSVAAAAGCDLLLSRGESVFLDAKALLPAPRAFDADGALFFFGETRLSFDEAVEGAVVSTLGAPDPDAAWRLDYFDEGRFSFFVLGPAAATAAAAGSGHYIHIALDAGSGRDSGIEAITRGAAERLEAIFFSPAPETYLIVTIEADGADAGDFTGTARPGGQHLVLGSAVSPLHLAVNIAHEMAHHWDLSLFRRLQPIADLEWMREGLAEYLAHRVLAADGVIPETEFISRANRALSNLALEHSPQIIAYDEGYLVWFALDQAAADDARFNGFLRELIAPSGEPLTASDFWTAAADAGLWPGGEESFNAGTHLPCAPQIGERRYRLVRASWPGFEAGFTFDPELNGRVAHVTEGGPAERAGLRAGDRVERTLGSPGFGNIHEPVVLGLTDRRVITFMPHGTRGAPYLQYTDVTGGENAPDDAEAVTTCRPSGPERP